MAFVGQSIFATSNKWKTIKKLLLYARLKTYFNFYPLLKSPLVQLALIIRGPGIRYFDNARIDKGMLYFTLLSAGFNLKWSILPKKWMFRYSLVVIFQERNPLESPVSSSKRPFVIEWALWLGFVYIFL